MKTAVVLGATGLVGHELVKVLLHDDRYIKVRLLLRHPMGLQRPGMEQVIVDFDRLEEYRKEFRGNEVFICLGTTMKKAGSKEAFRHVDHDLVLKAAQIAAEEGARRLMVVSSIGADAASSNFYLKTKGEMEEAVKTLPFEAIHIFRPSILLGDRQETRIGESIGKVLARLFAPIMLGSLRKYRPLHARTVARAMHIAANNGDPGLHIYESPEVAEMGKGA